MINMFIDFYHYLVFDFQVHPHSVTADNYKTTAVFTVYIWNVGHAKKKPKLCLSNSEYEVTNNNVVLLPQS